MQEIAAGMIVFPSRNNPFSVSKNKLHLKRRKTTGDLLQSDLLRFFFVLSFIASCIS